MKKYSALLALSILSFSVAVLGQTEADVDRFIRAEMERQKIPGVSLAVVREGKPIIVKGYGLANVEHQVAVKPETIFQSGSVGKQFTAMAVMTLVEEGKIAPEDKVGKYLGTVPDAWKNITIRHMLSQTSGMGDYPIDFDYRRDYTEDDLLAKNKAAPLAFEPGAKWQYSNLAYVTLGAVIRKASGKFYGDLLQERVFKPLGMTNTRIISEADIIPNRASGYSLLKGELKNHDWVSPTLNTTADGALYTTTLDMMKWDEALASGKLLKKSSYDEMWSPIKLNDGKTHAYGFGWAIRVVNGRRLIEHGGAWQGFKAQISRYLDDKLTVIVLANLAQTNQSKIAEGVAEIVIPGLKPPVKPTVAADAAVTARSRALFQAVLDGKADMNRFTPPIQTALAEQQDRLANFIKTLGPIQKYDLVETERTPEGTFYRYRVEFTGMRIFLAEIVGKDGKISSYALQPE